jgi:hypothetical protein
VTVGALQLRIRELRLQKVDRTIERLVMILGIDEQYASNIEL